MKLQKVKARERRQRSQANPKNTKLLNKPILSQPRVTYRKKSARFDPVDRLLARALAHAYFGLPYAVEIGAARRLAALVEGRAAS